MISDTLKSAYLWHKSNMMNRAAAARAVNPSLRGTAAIEAWGKAMADRNQGIERYPSDISAAVCWQKERGHAFIQNLDGAGLRYVGRSSIEGRRGAFSSSESEGWITDPHGEYAKDGTGLCWGVVYQLPGRNGKARFVPGYIMGGDSDDLPTLDLGCIYDEDVRDGPLFVDMLDAARAAARRADDMAKRAAEEEREYQTAWQAGSQYAGRMEEVAELRQSIKDDLAARRKIRSDMAAAGVGKDSREWSRACSMFRERVATAVEAIPGFRAEMRKLAAGDFEGLQFWAGDKRLQSAFNEGSGETIFSV